jgi:hypothetical protein
VNLDLPRHKGNTLLRAVKSAKNLLAELVVLKKFDHFKDPPLAVGYYIVGFKHIFLGVCGYIWFAHALMSRKRRLPEAFSIRKRMSWSAFANGIGSVSVSQTAFALARIDCSMYIIFFLTGEHGTHGRADCLHVNEVFVCVNIDSLDMVESVKVLGFVKDIALVRGKDSCQFDVALFS